MLNMLTVLRHLSLHLLTGLAGNLKTSLFLHPSGNTGTLLSCDWGTLLAGNRAVKVLINYKDPREKGRSVYVKRDTGKHGSFTLWALGSKMVYC